MQISNRAELAVECLAWLLTCSQARPGKTIWLADRIQHSVSYTEALLACLRESGLVAAKKGAGGGYYLTRPAEDISVAHVLAIFDAPEADAPRQYAAAPAEGPPDLGRVVEDLYRGLRRHTMLYLNGVSLADVERLRVAAACGNDERTESVA